jgi:hypothetical protein
MSVLRPELRKPPGVLLFGTPAPSSKHRHGKPKPGAATNFFRFSNDLPIGGSETILEAIRAAVAAALCLLLQ